MNDYKKIIDRILILLRASGATQNKNLRLIHQLLIYKIMVDFKHEEKYIRDEHIMQRYLENINFNNLINSTDNISYELHKQMRDILDDERINFEEIIDLSVNIMHQLLNLIQEFDFTKDIVRGNYQDIVNKVFLILNYISEQNGQQGSENTTPQIINTIIKEILSVKNSETLLDPCYGFGSLAITVGQNSKVIYGQEINTETYGIGKLNNLIANKDNYIKMEDSLINCNNSADVVVCNSPFSIKAYNIEQHHLDYLKWGNPPVGNADYNFISLVLDKMKDRGAIIVSEGVLFRGGKEGEIRKNIIKDNFIDGIISLPGGVFKNTAIPTNILFFSKNKSNTDIFMLDARELFTKTRGGVDYSEENLQKIISTYKSRENVEGFSKCVSLEEIESNDFVLSVNRYIDKPVEIENIDTKDLIKEIKTLEKEIKESKKETDEILKRLMEEME